MDTFGFTKKKLLSLSEERQHYHLINWLTQFYQGITTNRLKKESFVLFTRQYQQVLGWTRMASFVPPATDNPRAWLEAVSDQIHYHRTAMGIMPKDHDLISDVNTGDKSLSSLSGEFCCTIALDNLRSAFNTGSIIRSCEAAGSTSIILGNMIGPSHPAVRKTAMGAEQWVSVDTSDNLAQTLMTKKRDGFTIIGVETVKGSTAYDEVEWDNNTILVFGNEEYGLSTHVMAICDAFVHIPMVGRKNSINVANAVSIVCFHVNRYLMKQG